MVPNLATKVRNKQTTQKAQHDKKSRPRTFSIGSNVLVHNFTTGPEWLFGTIVSSKGPVSYLVKLYDGHHIKRHVGHLRKTEITVTSHDTVPEQLTHTTTTFKSSNSIPPTPTLH